MNKVSQMSSTVRHSPSLSELGDHQAPADDASGRSQDARRTDITGLRGIAVLVLLAVHLFPSWSVGGGVVGIDIFFVISGFLITRSLLASPDSGRRGLSSFYARRLHAFVPALCVTLVSCLAFAWLFTTPAVLMDLSRLAASAAFAVSNVLLWRDNSAVNLGPNGSPLFHLWAVALLAQWCVVWPLVLRFLVARKHPLVSVVGASCAVLFLLNLGWADVHPDDAFFLLPTRLWELQLGALLACLIRDGADEDLSWLKGQLARRPAVAAKLPEALAWSGATLLVLSMLLASSAEHFPAWWAMLPTLGTFALLAAGPEAWVNRHVLSQPILRFYGEISYPLFLWHWPLLSFPPVMGVPLTSELRVIILVASVALSTLSYELVARREPRVMAWSTRSTGLAAGLIGIGLIATITVIAGGFPQSFPEAARIGVEIDHR
jgi:peptidoglycan/LPS O-acetylase OafA/YrhL